MAIATTDAMWTALDVVADVAIECDGALFNEAHVKVYYGESNALAVLNTDYTVDLAVDFYSFEIIPTASLITKIEDSEETNEVFVVRETPATTDATPSAAGRANFISREFERTIMRIQELERDLAYTLRAKYGEDVPSAADVLAAQEYAEAAAASAAEAEDWAMQAAGMPVVTVTTHTTLLSSHNGLLIRVNSASPVNITVAPDLPDSFTCALLQLGDGAFTLVEGVGVTIMNKYDWFDSEGPGALVGVSWHADNMYVIGGDLSL